MSSSKMSITSSRSYGSASGNEREDVIVIELAAVPLWSHPATAEAGAAQRRESHRKKVVA